MIEFALAVAAFLFLGYVALNVLVIVFAGIAWLLDL